MTNPLNMEYEGGHGIHITVDCCDIGNASLLVDEFTIGELFSSLIATTGMTPVGQMHVAHFPARSQTPYPSETPQTPYPVDVLECMTESPNSQCSETTQFASDFRSLMCLGHSPKASSPRPVEDMGGLTAFQILGESHLSIHTFPSRRAFSLDLFSCCPYDYEAVYKLIGDTLQGGKMNVSVLRRSFS